MATITHYETVSDLYAALGMPIEQDASFTIDSLLDIHDTIPYASPVFRTNYYSFIFVKRGSGNYTTDDLTFEYGDHTIYFTNPGHLKAFEFYALTDAHLITLSEAFLKENVHQDVFQEFPFLLAETVPPQQISPEAFADVERLYLQLLSEYRKDSAYKFRILGNLFVVLLLKIKESFWGGYLPLEEGDRSSQIVKAFKLALEANFRELAEDRTLYQLQAQDYARVQGLNANYFSQVIKSKTGKSVTQWMAEKRVAQANAYLLHAGLSVKEIAFRLGFAETAHFSTFYKKNTGRTPTGFRKMHR